MARPKDSYIIEVRYPENNEKLIELRKRMGISYMEFITGYITELPICSQEKNKLYMEIMEQLGLNFDKYGR